jgi:signal peptidase I
MAVDTPSSIGQNSQGAGTFCAPVTPEGFDGCRLAQQVRERGHIILRVSGGSMGPWLVPGDILVVRQVDPGKLACGNVIVFARGGRLIVHRILGKLATDARGERAWKTKGDSADQSDAPVCESELVGRVTSIERSGGSLSLQTRRQIAFGWLLAQVSPLSRFVYPGTRTLKNCTRMSTQRRLD